jgi:hypothetical protein
MRMREGYTRRAAKKLVPARLNRRRPTGYLLGSETIKGVISPPLIFLIAMNFSVKTLFVAVAVDNASANMKDGMHNAGDKMDAAGNKMDAKMNETGAKMDAAGAKMDAKMDAMGNAASKSAKQTKENMKDAMKK